MTTEAVTPVGELTEIPGASGRAFRVAKGQILRIIDLDGHQVADIVAYNADDVSEKMSQGFTRMYNANVNLGEGDRLFSNRNNVVCTITHDKIEQHDILYPPCTRSTTATLPG